MRKWGFYVKTGICLRGHEIFLQKRENGGKCHTIVFFDFAMSFWFVLRMSDVMRKSMEQDKFFLLMIYETVEHCFFLNGNFLKFECFSIL